MDDATQLALNLDGPVTPKFEAICTGVQYQVDGDTIYLFPEIGDWNLEGQILGAHGYCFDIRLIAVNFRRRDNWVSVCQKGVNDGRVFQYYTNKHTVELYPVPESIA